MKIKTYNRNTVGQFKRKKRLDYFAPVTFVTVITLALIVTFLGTKPVEYVEGKVTQVEEKVEEIIMRDNYDKLAENMKEKARQKDDHEQEVIAEEIALRTYLEEVDEELARRKAIIAEKDARLASSTEEYNSAIEAWNFYQEVK